MVRLRRAVEGLVALTSTAQLALHQSRMTLVYKALLPWWQQPCFDSLELLPPAAQEAAC